VLEAQQELVEAEAPGLLIKVLLEAKITVVGVVVVLLKQVQQMAPGKVAMVIFQTLLALLFREAAVEEVVV
jgi:hypothetical protein